MLDINLILLVITLSTFIFLVKYLNEKLYNPLLEYMNQRDEDLKSDRDSVNQNYAEIEALDKEAKIVLSVARKEATSSKNAIISETKEKIAKMVEGKKTEFSDNYKKFLENLGNERVSLKNTLLADTESMESALRDRFTSI